MQHVAPEGRGCHHRYSGRTASAVKVRMSTLAWVGMHRCHAAQRAYSDKNV